MTPAKQQAATQQKELASFLQDERVVTQITRALPAHVKPERFLRIAQTAIINNPQLLKADQQSLLRETVAIASLGLVLDPQLGEAWLIIAKGAVQRRVGYRGLAKLARQSDEIGSLSAQVVYENDPCEISLGDDPHVKHTIPLDEDRGGVRGVYATATLKSGEKLVEYMSMDQIEAHAKRYSDAYKHNSGPWTDDLAYPEMARKTVFRRLAKWLPQSPELADVLAAEARAEEMVDITPPTPGEGAVVPLEVPRGDAQDGKPHGKRRTQLQIVEQDILPAIETATPQELHAIMGDAMKRFGAKEDLRKMIDEAAAARERALSGPVEQGDPRDEPPLEGEVVTATPSYVLLDADGVRIDDLPPLPYLEQLFDLLKKDSSGWVWTRNCETLERVRQAHSNDIGITEFVGQCHSISGK